MKFTLSSTALSGRLQILSKVISGKNSMPILGCFLFQVENGQVSITASDGENVMRTTLPLDESDGNGSFAISSRTILDAVKELAEQPLTFEVDLDSYEVVANYQNGVYRFTAQNPEEYPKMNSLNGDVRSITIDSGMFVDNLARTLFATDNNDIRPVMNGIDFDLTPENLAIVASDGHKMVRCRIKTITGDPASFIMPKKPATILRNTLPHDGGDVTIQFNANAAEASFAWGTLYFRLIEGVFPNYNAAIPDNNPNELIVDRHALQGAIRRVLPFASMSSQLIRFRLEPGNLELSSEDLDFATSAKENLICEYNGQPMQIGFRGDFCMEILGAIESDDIIMRLGDPSRAGVVYPTVQPENEEIVMLIMPLLLTDQL